MTGIFLQMETRSEGILSAQSFEEFLRAARLNFSYPLSYVESEISWLGLLFWLPAPVVLLIHLGRIWKKEEEEGTTPLPPAVIAMVLLFYAQIMTVALFRGLDGRPPAARHLDFHALGLLVNLGALAWLCEILNGKLGKNGWWRHYALVGWLVVAVALAGGLAQLADTTRRELEGMEYTMQLKVKNLRRYLATGDISVLQGLPEWELPWPDVHYLAVYLDNRDFRAILPPVLRPPDLPPHPGRMTQAAGFVRALYPGLMGLGAVLLVVGWLRRERPCGKLAPRNQGSAAE